MTIFSQILAIIISILLLMSLHAFPNFYAKKNVRNIVRIIIFLWMSYVQIQVCYQHVLNNNFQTPGWFYLELCTLSGWITIILMVWPNKLMLQCFFPYAIFGPVLTLIVPNNYPLVTELSFYRFYFGHTAILFGFFYLYWYGFTDYHFSKDTILKSIISGLITIIAVELFNQYFNTNYILGDIEGALGIKLTRPFLFLLTIGVIGPVLIFLSYLPIYFFKPIYDLKNDQFYHSTWIQLVTAKIILKRKQL
ncbi:hypothetical protein SSYRP_v1c05480 [Spiroplasma syrphidicola EA-1]|uniref:Uncharacterized protein n=1 Tax=Spiroplasma syrphidicola EA-1 TaxID=1276229 RepID=R4U6D3_9MOLU|nr:YwaF family protein [Spiroplasma syrphidicola]AGM26138.1 hypothetical protein SSYRP_v1c05480 [Spiroplasma syrphidicola EA-1]